MQTVAAEILLLDDEAPSPEFSRQAIARYVPETSIHTASTVEEAMDILRTRRIDLGFLDIMLRSSDGFTFCQYIHREYPAVTVVILTGHVDFGAKSYDYEPFDFLVKPVDALRLERTFSRYTRARRDSDAFRPLLFCFTQSHGIPTEYSPAMTGWHRRIDAFGLNCYSQATENPTILF